MLKMLQILSYMGLVKLISRMPAIVSLLVSLFLMISLSIANAQVPANDIPTVSKDYILLEDVIIDPSNNKRIPLYRYQYIEREHTTSENLKNIGIMYGLTWVVYPIFQPKILKGAGGWGDYKKNLGEIVFDKDEPIWNFFMHPLSGSQLYLLYRADGYTRMEAFGMTFVTSTLFEFTVEIFTEPASVQDLYQTPVLGTVFGLGIETFSMYLLNTGSTFGKFLGHLINPATLLPIYEGRTMIIPKIEEDDKGAMLKLEVSF